MKIDSGFSLKPPTPEAKTAERDGHLKDAAKMYENHFLNEMVKAMRSTTGQEEGVVKQNFAEKIFTEQLDQQYVDGWNKKGGVGLADMIYTQIKDQYFGSTQKHINPLNPMLPIQPKHEPLGIPAPDTIQMKAIPPQPSAKLSYRFEVPSPAAGEFEVRAPMAGKVEKMQALEEGWNTVNLDHGQGLKSEITFPGKIATISAGTEIPAGQKLGQLDSGRPALAWNLDWT